MSDLDFDRDAPAVLRHYRRGDHAAVDALLKPYRPYPLLIGAALGKFCIGLVNGFAESGFNADPVIEAWIAEEPDATKRENREVLGGWVRGRQVPRTASTADPERDPHVLLNLADRLVCADADRTGEDPDKLLDAYLLRLASREDDS